MTNTGAPTGIDPAAVSHLKIDSDRHAMEPADLSLRYMPAAMRDRGPKPMLSSDMMSSSSILVDGVRIPRYEGKAWTEKHKHRLAEGRSKEFSVQSQVAGKRVAEEIEDYANVIACAKIERE